MEVVQRESGVGKTTRGIELRETKGHASVPVRRLQGWVVSLS